MCKRCVCARSMSRQAHRKTTQNASLISSNEAIIVGFKPSSLMCVVKWDYEILLCCCVRFVLSVCGVTWFGTSVDLWHSFFVALRCRPSLKRARLASWTTRAPAAFSTMRFLLFFDLNVPDADMACFRVGGLVCKFPSWLLDPPLLYRTPPRLTNIVYSVSMLRKWEIRGGFRSERRYRVGGELLQDRLYGGHHVQGLRQGEFSESPRGMRPHASTPSLPLSLS